MGTGASADNFFQEEVSSMFQAVYNSKAMSRVIDLLIRSAFWAVLLLLFLPPNLALGSDGKEFFKGGKCDLDAGRYEEAVEKLVAAAKEFPLLEDYALLYLSTAYHELGDHKKSLDAVLALIHKYPQSPLIKKARSIEIREAKENEGERILQIMDSYVRDYPEDEEMNFAYGLLLKQSGDVKRAKAVFKKIYILAGPLSKAAYAELKPSEVNSSDIVERAANLMKRNEFKEAEHELRKTLPSCDAKNREEILRNIGLSLFRQKQYKEAAEIYKTANDVFSKARSLYRAGDKQGFESALRELRAKKDKRAGGLLLAVASDRRKDGDCEGALEIYAEVSSGYPADAEEAMWGMGWTYYRTADYEKSAGIFSKLYAKYEDPKYLYWQARSTEAAGKDAKELYSLLSKYENNFYAGLSAAKGKIKAVSLAYPDAPLEVDNGAQRQFERVDALFSLGMTREASAELQWISRKIETPLMLAATASRFQKIGDYKRAVTLATRMPYSEKLHGFWYPLAFWDDVEKVSSKHDIDPMIALSVIREESRFDPDARSVAGARGLMQLMPHTAYRLDKDINLGISRDSQLNDVKKNINLGVYYLKTLFREFRSLPYVLAAYNAGEAMVRKWQQRDNNIAVDEFIEEIPYSETRNYVKKVVNSFFQYKRLSPSEAVSASLLLGSL